MRVRPCPGTLAAARFPMLSSRRTFVCASGAALAVPGLAQIPSGFRGADFDPKIGLTRGPEHAKELKEQGAEFLEVSCGGWLVPNRSDKDFESRKKKLLECGLPVLGANGFLPGKLKSTGPNADHDAVAKYAEVAFRRAQQVGIRTITFGSSGSRSLPKDFPKADGELQFVALLSRLAPLAAKHDVTVSVEPLQPRETNFIHFVSEAARLVRAVQWENVRITADIFHMLRGGEGPESILGAKDLIHHVHVAEKANRTAPGVDGDDFRAYLRALKEIGYGGLVSMECRWKDARAEFGAAREALQSQLEDL